MDYRVHKHHIATSIGTSSILRLVMTLSGLVGHWHLHSPPLSSKLIGHVFFFNLLSVKSDFYVADNFVEPSNIEERSAIDDANYVVNSEEHVVHRVSNFMAKCILSNPKS
ncbi:hypothetical protein K1719_033944 [Acacia pycnantha]|nr:hypothetical protein K1719_033944 [Acacia pycnantha]